MPDELTRIFYFNPYALPVLVVAVLIPLTGFYIFLQNRKSAANKAFFFLCIAILFWLSGQVMVYAAKEPALALTLYRRVAFFGVVLISPTVYFFSTVWLGLYEGKKISVRAGFLGAAFFYVLGLLSHASFPGVRQYYWGYYPIYGVFNWFFLIFFFGYFFAAFYNFFAALRREKEKIRLLQIKYILIAFLVSFLSSLDYVPKLISFSLYPLGFFYVFFWISLVAYAIIRYKAMDIQTVIHKTIMWFAITAIAVGPFAVILHFVQPVLQTQSSWVTTACYLTLLLVFYFYFGAILPRLDRLFRRRMANLNAISIRFADELVHLKNLRDLLQSTMRMLRKTLFIKTASIYLEAENEIKPVIVKKIRGLGSFPVTHPFLEWLEGYNAIVQVDRAMSDPDLTERKSFILEYASKVEAVIIIPLILGGKLVGVINLGMKDNLKRYTDEEVTFLKKIKAAITIAFSNSLHLIAMQENLEKWNNELERKVEERTAQLLDTQAQLVQAEKLATIGTLAGGVAHEINNPLAAVLANAQMLKMTANPDDIDSIDLIEEGAKRCQIIIQKLMKYARKPMGPEVVGRVDINKVVDDTVAFLKYQMEQENIRIEVEKKIAQPFVSGNPNELEQVITNLILNAKDAIKQTDRSGVIQIQTLQDNGSVNISVRDNGIGIPQENLQKIFDPFFTTKELGKGTGLGLAVSYGIVQKHQARIDVASELGKGSVFSIVFPKRSE